MGAILSVFTVVTLSILVTKVATVALAHTGLSRELARFQARSAFTGVGFTTREAEKIVNHPVRRRIVMVLMLLGNVGIVSVLSSLVLTFIDTESSLPGGPYRVLILAGGVAALWVLGNSSWVDRTLNALISRGLRRWTDLDVRDYAGLLRISGDYEIAELAVEEEDWIADRSLAQCALREEGVIVLGIQRPNGKYLGAPNGSTRVVPGDVLLLYGRDRLLERLDDRPRDIIGDAAHDEAVAEQQRVEDSEAADDEVDGRSKEGD